MNKFTFRCDNKSFTWDESDADVRTTEISFHASTWPEVLEEVKPFLAGCGYFLPEGVVDVVEPVETDSAVTLINNLWVLAMAEDTNKKQLISDLKDIIDYANSRLEDEARHEATTEVLADPDVNEVLDRLED